MSARKPSLSTFDKIKVDPRARAGTRKTGYSRWLTKTTQLQYEYRRSRCDFGQAVSHLLTFAAAQSVVEFQQPLFLLRQGAGLCVLAAGFVRSTASLPAKQGNRTSYY